MKLPQLVKNPYLDALIKTILTFATIHLILSLLYTLLTGNLFAINIFYIMALNLFFPDSVLGIGNLVLSYVVVAVVYSILLFLHKKH